LAVAVLFALEYRVPFARRALFTAVVAGPALFVAASATILVMALLGYQPLWNPGADLTLVEAAYHTDRAAVSRLIDRGADPNAPGPVIVENRRTIMTPLEAAVIGRDLELMQLLVRRGAVVNDSNRQDLACLASESGDRSIVNYFQGSLESDATACDEISRPTH
jgi:hypothetical protein